MTKCTLNNIFLFYVHNYITNTLDLFNIDKDFVSVNFRWINYLESSELITLLTVCVIIIMSFKLVQI